MFNHLMKNMPFTAREYHAFQKTHARKQRTKQTSMKQEFSCDEARDDGEDPHQDFEDVPSSSRVFIHHEGKAVSHHDHVRFCLAVRHGVFCEDQKVEEDDQVGHDQTRPRVLEIVPKLGVDFQTSKEAQTPTP